MESSANQPPKTDHKYNTRYKGKKNLVNYKEMSKKMIAIVKIL